jgi:hypothetical protein
MSSPVLVLSNDFSLAAAKTSRHLCQALRRLGRTAVGRDTRLIRWAAAQAESASPTRRQAYEDMVVSKWHKFMFDYGYDTVISLDLHWLFTPRLFIASNLIRSIHSFWFDDLRSHLQSAPMFSLGGHAPLELINGPKVSHHCYGRGQMEELRMLGVKRVLPSALAAPSEYIETNEPCRVRDRIAFIGNPGLPSPPTARASKTLEKGESLAALRRLAQQEILEELPSAQRTASWVRQCPQVAALLATATELRLTQPYTAAISLLVEAGKTHSEAFDFLNRTGVILDAAMLVKLVNRYDRPALALRLHRRGWLDVYGTPEQWTPYGITARPTVTFPELASVYRRYVVHLNGANCARDATANEKLFEIAACGRLSLNLDSPDVRACYSGEEVILAESDDALVAEAERVLRNPDAALAMGEKARQRTASDHLWEHRLKKALT